MITMQLLKRAAGVTMLAALSAMTASAGAATVDYIQLSQNGTPIKGGSTSESHKGWSEISSFNWGVTVPFSLQGPGGSSGKPDFSDLSWTQMLDQSFTPVFSAATKGTSLSAELDFVKTTNDADQTYFKMNFTGVHITELGLAGSSLPEESASFAYTTIKFTYYPQNPNGSLGQPLTASYNLATNKGDLAELGVLYADGLNGPLSPAPEPGTYAMLLAGLGLIGMMAKRQSKQK